MPLDNTSESTKHADNNINNVWNNFVQGITSGPFAHGMKETLTDPNVMREVATETVLGPTTYTIAKALSSRPEVRTAVQDGIKQAQKMSLDLLPFASAAHIGKLAGKGAQALIDHFTTEKKVEHKINPEALKTFRDNLVKMKPTQESDTNKSIKGQSDIVPEILKKAIISKAPKYEK